MTRLRILLLVWLCLAAAAVLYYAVLRERVLHLSQVKPEVFTALALFAVTLLSALVALVAGIVRLATRHGQSVAAAAGILTLGSGTLLALMVVLSQVTAYTPHVDGPNPISELRRIEVNGRQEWLSIRGEDRSNPVLLFLSGGPGGSQLVTSRYYFAALEKDYTVVTWEQPGAGKSYWTISPEQITLDTYLDDGEAVTRYLTAEFGQDRIWMMGESWGSALGLMMIREQPDLYRGFIGTGQMVSFLDTEIIDYNLAIADLRSIGDHAAADRLVQQGPPPYTSGVALKTNAYLSPLYGTMARTGQLNPTPFSTMEGPYGVEYGLVDKFAWFWGLYRTFDTFYPDLYPVDLRTTAVDLAVPVFIFHGAYDYNAPKSLVEDYYERLQAPAKELLYFQHSGHNPWQTENELFLTELRQRFR